MNTESATPTTTIPIVCNPSVFSKEERDEHMALALDAIFRLPTRTEELEDGYLFHYRGNDELFLKLARFIHGEHRCCAWGGFSLEIDPFEVGALGAIRLRYIASGEAKSMLTEALQKFRPASENAKAHARLQSAFRDVEDITPENRDEFYARLESR